MNILIPMAGNGQRFKDAGYTLPKPLIEVNGKPMIQVVIESLGLDANYIFVVNRIQCESFDIERTLRRIVPDCVIRKLVIEDNKPSGQAISTLEAKYFINDSPLIIANADQYIEWDKDKLSADSDGVILTFNSSSPKHSFAMVENGEVARVAEKEVISNQATVGVYYWKHGTDYVKYAEQMVKKGITTNGEYYTAPVFNEAIADGKKITTLDVETMHGMGTPEELEKFLYNFYGHKP
jgi:dTDP-glucose pyrophosphorylase